MISIPQPEPRPGDLLLFYGGRRLGWWIERATRSPFYHVALYDRDGCVVDAVPRGVVLRSIDDGTTGTRFIIAPAPDGCGETALAWAKTQIGKPFDAPGMLLLAVTLSLGRPRLSYRPTTRFTCSHLAAAAFRHAGIDLVPRRPSALVTPADLAHLASPADITHAWHASRRPRPRQIETADERR